ncbi:conserved hypothetical protein [Theileria equi strain WA]|uniref:Uncharacterized protein n=1 Tax=Theileria equi strain WA TaxID=1537102 RepID=L1LE90_THEEQ|nr:conserved hypothetical protein [Theileria equi strain WA]EKX73565.1 conserved hypothetical protein [Theileria equi strain WA]|eukprot:XP_004833017.1 conserved hypothetical protein [Theileria equi strain WA]
MSALKSVLNSFSRPPGGGPAPLIKNPVQKWLRVLVILHVSLLLLACSAVSFPFINDLHCSILTHSLANIFVSAIGSAIMAGYYLRVASQDWGTEWDWEVTAIVTASVVVVDTFISGWGIYELSNASIQIYKGIHKKVKIEPECLQFKAAIFYIASFAVIFSHIIVAGICAVVSVLLTKGIKKQLNDVRHIV